MTILLSTLLLLAVVAGIVTIRAMHEAREGVEDETGFHFVVAAGCESNVSAGSNRTNLSGRDFADGVA